MNTVQDVTERIRAEFTEMPGMRLSATQVQRLCGVDEIACRSLLEALVAVQFLSVRSDGTYVRRTDAEDGGWHGATTQIARRDPGFHFAANPSGARQRFEDAFRNANRKCQTDAATISPL
jgi:hypothetical protein